MKNTNFVVFQMDIIEQFWVSVSLSMNFQVIHNVPMEAHMT